jgi:hypothetical protein
MIAQPTIHLPYADRDTNLPVSIYLGHLSSGFTFLKMMWAEEAGLARTETV